MANKDPIDDLFEEIGSLLRFIEKNLQNVPSAEDLPPDINDRLDAIEKRVEALNRISEDIVRAVDVPKEELKMRLEGISQSLTDEDRKILAKGESLKSTLEMLDKRAIEINEQIATEKSDEGKSEGKESPANSSKGSYDALLEEELYPKKKNEKPVEGRKRKNKFKRFGGDDKWKPL